jgi:hypothetical protein
MWDAERGDEGVSIGAAGSERGLYESSGSELSSPQALRLKTKVDVCVRYVCSFNASWRLGRAPDVLLDCY